MEGESSSKRLKTSIPPATKFRETSQARKAAEPLKLRQQAYIDLTSEDGEDRNNDIAEGANGVEDEDEDDGLPKFKVYSLLDD